TGESDGVAESLGQLHRLDGRRAGDLAFRRGRLRFLSQLSHDLRLNAGPLFQVICDVDGVGLLDAARDDVNVAAFDPHHARSDTGVVTQRHAVDALDGDRLRRCVLDRDGDEQRRAGVTDRPDRRLELLRDPWLREDESLELLHGDLRRLRRWRGGLGHDELWRIDAVRTG